MATSDRAITRRQVASRLSVRRRSTALPGSSNPPSWLRTPPAPSQGKTWLAVRLVMIGKANANGNDSG